METGGWNHTPYFPWECGLERRVSLLVEFWIQEDQCGVRGFHGTLNQLFILSRTIEGGWEFAQLTYMRFVDLEKSISLGVSWSMWCLVHCYDLFYPSIIIAQALFASQQ